MSYEVLEKQIKSLPEEALADVSAYIEKMDAAYKSKKEKLSLSDLKGKIQFADDYDYKEMKII